MGGNCCGSKPKKILKNPPKPINPNLPVAVDALYSDSKYFKPNQQRHYNHLLMEEAPLMETLAPNHWESSEIIGQGSFGRVLFGRELEANSLLAIKEIPLLGLSNIPIILEEVQILSQLNHQNIIRYLGSKLTKEFLLIFMEYASGGTIESLLSKYGRFSESLIRLYTYQILKGLEYLHFHNIVHRDLKGTNILVSHEGYCKLADFGSAKKILGLEVTFSVTGSFNWMAPEIICETGHGRFADIWSVGCLVVEMATGKPPWYECKNHLELFNEVCKSNSIPILPSEFSEDAKSFVALCFKRKPNDRPNVTELLQHAFVTQYENTEFFKTESIKYLSDNFNST